LIAYKNVFDDKPISETAKNLINWYVTTVIPIVHVSSRARNNWRPFASVSGAYSTIVTLSDEAFTFTERHDDEKDGEKADDKKENKSENTKKLTSTKVKKITKNG